MRFEVVAARALGLGLPLMEVLRRRTNFDSISGYVDDFLVGGLLLFAAWSASRRGRRGRILLVAAWGILCGGLYGSFFGQMENPSATDISGLPNAAVVCIKGAIYIVAVTGLILSVRSSSREQGSASPSPAAAADHARP